MSAYASITKARRIKFDGAGAPVMIEGVLTFKTKDGKVREVGSTRVLVQFEEHPPETLDDVKLYFDAWEGWPP